MADTGLIIVFLVFSIAAIASITIVFFSATGISGPSQSVDFGRAMSVFSSSLLSVSVQSIENSTVVVNGYASGVSYLVWNWGDGRITTGFFPQTHTFPPMENPSPIHIASGVGLEYTGAFNKK